MTGSCHAGVSEVATLLHQGQRKTLEDRVRVGSWWWSVADGMGGEGAGDLAASATVGAAATVLRRDSDMPASEPRALRRLRAVGVEAQQAVVDAAFGAEVLTAGSTLLVLLLSADHRLHVGWIGDSRAYLASRGRVSCVTRDHTFVATSDVDRTSPVSRGGLTRHLGYRAAPATDSAVLDVLSFDQPRLGRVVLRSDGVWSAIPAAELDAILLRSDTAARVAADLRHAVLAAGAPDNFAAVVIDFDVE